MAATLLQLKDQIVIDAGIMGDAKFPSARLVRIINLAQRYVQTQLGALGFPKWITSQVVTAGLAAGAFGSGTNNVKKIPIGATYFVNLLEFPKAIKFIEVNDGISYGVAYEVEEDEFYNHVTNTYLQATVKEAKFIRLAGNVWIYPTSVTNATAYYHKAITDLSADADVTEIPLEYEEYIIKRAIAEIDSINGKLNDKMAAVNQITKEITDSYKTTLMRLSEETRPKKEKPQLQ